MQHFKPFGTTLVMLALVLVGCETVPPEPVQAPPAEAAPSPAEPAPGNAQIERLLHEAEIAFDQNRLTTPVDDNAWLRYLRVLSLDPGNELALQGLSDIVDKYLAWAISNASGGNFKRAERYLNSARSVDDRHPAIPTVARRIEEMQEVEQDVYPLPETALRNRDAAVADQLQELARLAETRDALVVIGARSDAEGRWIYQQMNDATELRLRARLELRSTPSIRMLFEEAQDLQP